GREIMRPAGVTDELRAALTTGGDCWGTLCLFPASGHAFTDGDTGHLMQVLGAAAAGARSTLAAPHPASDACPAGGPGTLTAPAPGTPLGAPREAGRWPPRLSPAPRPSQATTYPLAAFVTARATSQKVRVRAGDGGWLDIHASPLLSAVPGCDIAVTIQAA